MILTGTRDDRLDIGRKLGADHVINVTQRETRSQAVKALNGGKGVDYVIDCSGAGNALNEAMHMANRGGKVCLAAFPHEPAPVDIAPHRRNNIYLYGIRGEGKSATHRAEAFMRQKRFDAQLIHTHTFPLEACPSRRSGGSAAPPARSSARALPTVRARLAPHNDCRTALRVRLWRGLWRAPAHAAAHRARPAGTR